jgi:hypothetical protein
MGMAWRQSIPQIGIALLGGPVRSAERTDRDCKLVGFDPDRATYVRVMMPGRVAIARLVPVSQDQFGAVQGDNTTLLIITIKA